MKTATRHKIVGIALIASALLGGAPAAMSASGPEVMPKIDNPNNPSVPNAPETNPNNSSSPGRDQSGMRTTPDDNSRSQPGATAEGRARCGALTDTLARRRCLEELQRSRND